MVTSGTTCCISKYMLGNPELRSTQRQGRRAGPKQPLCGRKQRKAASAMSAF